MKNRDHRRVKRIRLDQPLRVVMCSIGAQVKYELQTRDISNTGFFLEFENPGRFPFNASSIMEVWMQFDDGQTVFFNGKMARVVHRSDNGSIPGIAIRIVQIDKDNEDKLKDFIDANLVKPEDESGNGAA
ncbi:MAG: PilZ domain-containing protein [Oligoflexales bacterium]